MHVIGRRGALLLPLLARPALACARQLVAALPLRLVDGYPVVTGSIAGQAVSLVLDTGAQGMLINPEFAAAARLPLRGMVPISGTGGGSTLARLVLLPGLRLGGATMPDQVSPVAALPVTLTTEPPLAGLLGASLLSRFDVEIDVRGGRLMLWAASSCVEPGTTLPLEVSRVGEPFLPVRLNGENLLALLDTGSRATLLTEQTAKRLGLAPAISLDKAAGVDMRPVATWNVLVRLALGSEPPVPTPVRVASLTLEHGDMLLGLDVLRRRRFVVAYGRGEVTFAPAP